MSHSYRKHFELIFFVIFMLFCQFGVLATAGQEIADVRDSKNILPEKERARVQNEWLKWRLDNILPELMRREGIDMWLVINREYNEDAVYLSLVPRPTMYARRTSILIFHDLGPEKGVERLSGSYYGMGEWYKATWVDKKKKQFESLAEVIRARNPKKIGINVSENWAFGDGLSASLKEKLEKALGPGLASRFVSAENLCVGWLETRSPQELSVYRHIAGIAHDIIAEFFSNRVIIPDITTTEDVVWWIRQRITDLGLEAWFQPSISIQRHKKEQAKYGEADNVIRRGDLLHCDVGIYYLGLCTDMQLHAYVCRIGEDDAPPGLQEALRRANRVADIFMAEFKVGRSGNDIVDSAMKKATAEGLRPLIYSHPLGTHGHGAGCTADARPPESAPEDIRERGKYPLYPNTVYAIEFSSTTAVPEWDNQDVRIGYEETGAFTGEGCRFIDGRQTKFFLIK
ncbi:MAG: M24 family metallopeptidase [Clostridiales bacterium]|nr:M24 family metallopeptidase [Clostridiales bacterium]